MGKNLTGLTNGIKAFEFGGSWGDRIRVWRRVEEDLELGGESVDGGGRRVGNLDAKAS